MWVFVLYVYIFYLPRPFQTLCPLHPLAPLSHTLRSTKHAYTRQQILTSYLTCAFSGCLRVDIPELLPQQDDPEVYTLGRTEYDGNKPSSFQIANHVVKVVACGGEHSAIITDKRQLFTFGKNNMYVSLLSNFLQ